MSAAGLRFGGAATLDQQPPDAAQRLGDLLKRHGVNVMQLVMEKHGNQCGRQNA
jgi:hypothetical protein